MGKGSKKNHLMSVIIVVINCFGSTDIVLYSNVMLLNTWLNEQYACVLMLYGGSGQLLSHKIPHYTCVAYKII